MKSDRLLYRSRFDAQHVLLAARLHVLQLRSAKRARIPDYDIVESRGVDRQLSQRLLHYEPPRRIDIDAIHFADDVEHVVLVDLEDIRCDRFAIPRTAQANNRRLPNVVHAEVGVQRCREVEAIRARVLDAQFDGQCEPMHAHSDGRQEGMRPDRLSRR